MKTSFISAAAFAVQAVAAPAIQARTKGPTDADILNYALTLEHLEDTFYRTGLANFTVQNFIDAGFDEPTYNRIKTVAADEASHVEFLTTALQAINVKPVAECTYAFGVTDVKSFLGTAAVLEGVGVSAYLGAAAKILDKNYLTLAGSILTVEARHTSYVRNRIDQNPFAQPFDNPLDLNEVYTLAAGFITSCPPSNPKLPVKAFPSLTAKAQDAVIKTGTTLTLTVASGKTTSSKLYAAFITVTGPIFVDVQKSGSGFEVKVPEGVNGQSYVVLTSCKDASDDNIVAGPAIVEVTNS